MMEFVLKVFLSLVIIIFSVASLRWIWTGQIDLRITVTQLTEKVTSPPDWIVTRDPQKIYQNGVAVGDVRGEVHEGGNHVRFDQIVNSGDLDIGKEIEYRRLTLKIAQVGAQIGMKSAVSNNLRQVLVGVLEEVICTVERK